MTRTWNSYVGSHRVLTDLTMVEQKGLTLPGLLVLLWLLTIEREGLCVANSTLDFISQLNAYILNYSMAC